MHLTAAVFEELRVPVERVAVELHTELDRYATVVFLSPGTNPVELFDGTEPFFAAEENGKVRFFARASLSRIVVDGGEAAPASLEKLGVSYESRGVLVRFRSGRVLTGLVMSMSGDGRGPRTLDMLNERAKSFAVHADGKIHHVAKEHVAWVQELR